MSTDALLCTLLVTASTFASKDGQERTPSTRPSTTSPAPQASRPATRAAQQDYVQLLAQAEKQIRETPNRPLPYYRRCQYLMKLKRYEEGYKAAHEAMNKYIAAGDGLAWMLIDTIDLDRFRVDVHFNMGPDERHPPGIGIARPLSFRAWTKGDERRLVDILDFELGYYDGKPTTAAFGRTTGGVHANYGNARINMSYTEIREVAKKLITALYEKKGE
jgi:tetratricopeptide (TPR) repeat protein